jgi:DNA-binding response OmpR family regulator
MTKKILIADDEQNIVISLEFLLSREKMNGFDVCQALRADPDLAGLRILMLTAKGRETEVSKGLGLGADAYMTKPFSTRELVEKVRALLGM